MSKRCTLLVLASLWALVISASRLEAFTRTATRLEARDAFTTTALPDGRVLVVGGVNPTPPKSFKTSCEIYDRTPLPWSLVGSLQVPRANHTATLLQNGKVFVVGGQNATGILSSAEIYDPATNVWQEVAPALSSHVFHTATLLPSGKVLIYGGSPQSGPSAVELYDPFLDSWTFLKTLSVPALRHTATLLPEGKLLVLPEASSGLQPEIYDSQNDSWQTLPPPGGPAYSDYAVQHSATLLESGEVLITRGGCNPCAVQNALLYQPADLTWRFTENQVFQSQSPPRTALLPSGRVFHLAKVAPFGGAQPQVFDPATNTWSYPSEPSQTNNFLAGPLDFTTTLLANGEVLLTGFDSKSSYVFQPNLSSWMSVGPLSQPRAFLTLTSTHSGVIAIGGKNQNTASGAIEVFSDSSLAWSTLGSLNIPRFKHTATLMPNGKILVAGGQNPSQGTMLPGELVDPQTGQSTILPGLLIRTEGQHTATLLPNGEVLFVGGTWSDPRTYLFNLETGTLRQAASLRQFRFEGHTATLLPNGKILVAGGQALEVTARVEFYDPVSNQWAEGPSLVFPRSFHSATLHPQLGIFVAGGNTGGLATNIFEIFGLFSDRWTITSTLLPPRDSHVATLLPNETVVVLGGRQLSGDPTANAEVFSATTAGWRAQSPLNIARTAHQVALTPAGNLLVAGGDPAESDTETASTEILHFGGSATRKPVLSSTSGPLRHDQPFGVTLDAGPGAAHEASYGGHQSSHSRLPHFLIQAASSGNTHFLTPRQHTPLAGNVATYTFPELPASLDPGQHFLYAVVNGVLSQPRPVTFECSTFITSHPANQTVALGESATFTVLAKGARSYQWQKDGADIPGANLPSYTTPAASAADAGSRYRVRVDGGCRSVYSENARLDIADGTAPVVTVTTPSGGEYWPLSQTGAVQERAVAWRMSDNIRLCRAEVALIYSNDGGFRWTEAPPGGGLPAGFGDGANCPFPGVGTTNLIYTVPTAPPSSNIGSLYKIRVRVTDMAGNTAEALSTYPFFIVQSDTSSAQSLILHNLPRMQTLQGITESDLALLTRNLHDLANHSRVHGRLIDLSLVPQLSSAYDAWDAEPGDPDLANELVQTLRRYLKDQIFPIHNGVRSIVIVGDDRIFPMARIRDTTALKESAYSLPGQSTVARALRQNYYLSDDILGVLSQLDLPLSLTALRRGAFLPNLSVGRLVEEPNEIITTIETYIRQNGIIDLATTVNPNSHKVLVTGYDFLQDSARSIHSIWGTKIPSASIAELIGQDWTADQLRSHLDAGYAIFNLNGHATHYLEGTPNLLSPDIEGLPAANIYGPHDCGSQLPVNLAGAVVYAVGCHGGLTVPGTCATDSDKSLDLPQSFLARGAVAYIANSGFGWGLLRGVGLSERLVELFTLELLADHTTQIGEAFLRAKLRYYLELPSFDAYEQKTLLQWSLFGLPFYTLHRGGPSTQPSTARSIIGEISEERPEEESIDGVVVQRVWPTTLPAILPPDLIQLNLGFNLSAAGLYQKHDALGQDHPNSGCNEPLGCYYTLNGMATGTPDLPILPKFTYDSRLFGASQHGALWLGGDYYEESDFRPAFAELVSNAGDYSNHGATPRLIRPKPYPQAALASGNTAQRAANSELNSLVVVTGEVLRSGASPTFDRYRLSEKIDIEVFYLDSQASSASSDRKGPVISLTEGHNSFHLTDGAAINWSLRASDPAGVWRVVVVYDSGPDSNGRGRWIPLELSEGTDGIWQGSLVTAASRVTYFVQAVDRRGNVEWVDFSTSQGPASGSAPDLPEPIEVELDGNADLSLTLAGDINPMVVGTLLTYELTAQNLSFTSAHQLELTLTLPSALRYEGFGGEGWTCQPNGPAVVCQRATLAAISSSTIFVFATAQNGGIALAKARITALENDPSNNNNSATESTFIASPGDLSITQSAGVAIAGEGIVYTLAAFNHGSQEVAGATVTDVFPAGLTNIRWICLASPGSSCSESGEGHISDLVHLLPGGAVIYRAEARIDPGAVGPFINTATISNPAGDPQPGNNSSTVRSTVFVSLFQDGFESGDTRYWSVVAGLN